MKKESTNGLQAGIKFILSLALLCSGVIFLSGCDGYLDFEFPNIDLSGVPIAGPGPGNALTSGPVYIYADSVLTTSDDSLTLFGHFTPMTLDKDIQIVEYGFYVFDYFGSRKITLRTNEVWHFDTPDTLVNATGRMAQIKANIDAQFATYYIFKNEYGVDLYVQSDVVVIKKFEPSLIALHDSVTQYSSNQVILWGHLETKEDCELTQVTVNWGYRWNALNADIIKVPSQMKIGEIIQVADTIDVTPNSFYEWSISATAKFANDSTGTTPYVVNEFVSGN
jgi:hypothetical protein